MRKITISRGTVNNIKNISIAIPLGKLVAFVGKSGSGKSSLVHDLLYRASLGNKVEAKISRLPNIFMIPQRIKPLGKLSLGETFMNTLTSALDTAKKGDLLIVDEPCVGMAKEDRQAIIITLKKAVRRGISVFAVEHSSDLVAGSDYVIEFGPGSGAQGGKIVFAGPISEFRAAKTHTAKYVFAGRNKTAGQAHRVGDHSKPRRGRTLSISGINKHALKNFNFTFPLGGMVCVSGRIGTGKSTLLSVVYGALFKGRNAWKIRNSFKTIDGKHNVRRSYFIDQSPLGSSPTSTPATLLGIWDAVRALYAALPESKKLRLTKSAFVIGGKPLRNKNTAIEQIKYHGYAISDALHMTMDQAANVFAASPLVARKIGFLQEVGLGYLTLGQKTKTLSGGEAQRVRLAKILSKKLGDRCVYILDTPSKGLHLGDLTTLAAALRKIADKNNTILIADNREELAENCDEIIRL
jgi:excinuclease ABC subunit A